MIKVHKQNMLLLMDMVAKCKPIQCPNCPEYYDEGTSKLIEAWEMINECGMCPECWEEKPTIDPEACYGKEVQS